MTTSETDTAVWIELQRANGVQKSADTRAWKKNFVLVATSIALTLAIVAALGAGSM